MKLIDIKEAQSIHQPRLSTGQRALFDCVRSQIATALAETEYPYLVVFVEGQRSVGGSVPGDHDGIRDGQNSPHTNFSKARVCATTVEEWLSDGRELPITHRRIRHPQFGPATLAEDAWGDVSYRADSGQSGSLGLGDGFNNWELLKK